MRPRQKDVPEFIMHGQHDSACCSAVFTCHAVSATLAKESGSRRGIRSTLVSHMIRSSIVHPNTTTFGIIFSLRSWQASSLCLLADDKATTGMRLLARTIRVRNADGLPCQNGRVSDLSGKNNLVAAPLGTSEVVSSTVSPGERLRLEGIVNDDILHQATYPRVGIQPADSCLAVLVDATFIVHTKSTYGISIRIATVFSSRHHATRALGHTRHPRGC